MVRTPEEDIQRELKDPEYAKLFYAALAEAEEEIALAKKALVKRDKAK